MYIYIFVLITFCVITIVIISIFTIFFLVLSVVLAQVLFHVSRILKLYVNFSKFWFVSRFNLYVIACINSTELTNEFTTEDDRWTIETCLVLNLKVVVHFLKIVTCLLLSRPFEVYCRFEIKRTLRAAKDERHLLRFFNDCSSLSVPDSWIHGEIFEI